MMNRAKKEEIRKYNEAREGKSVEVIAEIDRQDEFDAQIKRLASLLHGRLFLEEYDFMSDSIADANDRKKGFNPMSESHIKKVDEKRRVLGFSPLSRAGETTENDTLEFCLGVAREASQIQNE
jgi:hypothetical protein